MILDVRHLPANMPRGQTDGLGKHTAIKFAVDGARRDAEKSGNLFNRKKRPNRGRGFDVGGEG